MGFDMTMGSVGRRSRAVSSVSATRTRQSWAMSTFGYDERPLYKRPPKRMRRSEFRSIRASACDDLIQRVAALQRADPPMDLQSHHLTRALVEELSPLDDQEYKRREDLLDAALCA
jgi:hypothetical protein